MKTVEELNDYWDSKPAPMATTTWAEMARKEGHKHRLPKTQLKPRMIGAENVKAKQCKRFIDAIADGPLARDEIAKASELSDEAVTRYGRYLVDKGFVTRTYRCHQPAIYALPE